MSKTIKIPDCMSPFIVMVNGVRYVYPAGETVEVPDEVALVIEKHNEYHEEKEKIENGEGNQGGGGGSSADFLALKESMTVYRNDEITSIPDYAFAGCKNLKHVILPSALVSGDGLAFWECTSLEILEVGTLYEGWWYGDKEESEDSYFNLLPVKAMVMRVEPGWADDPAYMYSFDHIYIPRAYRDVTLDNGDNQPVNYHYGRGFLDLADRVRFVEDYTVDGTITGELDLAKMGIEI